MNLAPVPVDDPRALALLEEYFAERAAGFPGGTYTPVFPAREVFTPPAGVFLVASEEGIDAGCGGVRRIADGPAGMRYEVKHLYLRAEARGLGWGGAIFDALETSAREFGAAEVVLDTHHTLTAAGALYAARGYRTIEPYNDNPNATRWYGKLLD